MWLDYFLRHREVARLLLDRRADAEAKDIDGRTPLSWAVSEGHENLVRTLLDGGADIEARDNYGRTPLHFAVNKGLVQVAALLLSRGADIEATNTDGWTAVRQASSTGHQEMVQLLFDCGAEVHDDVLRSLHHHGVDIEVNGARSWAALRDGRHQSPVKLIPLQTCKICNNLEDRNEKDSSLDLRVNDIREKAENGCLSCALLRDGIALAFEHQRWGCLTLRSLSQHTSPMAVTLTAEGTTDSLDLEFYTNASKFCDIFLPLSVFYSFIHTIWWHDRMLSPVVRDAVSLACDRTS
jgi:hypothetical protein